MDKKRERSKWKYIGEHLSADDMSVDPRWVIGFGLGTLLFSWLLSLLTTWRIRKISAYALVTE